MCLDTLKRGLPEWTRGYKVMRFKRVRGRVRMYGENFAMTKSRPRRRWLDEKDYRTIPEKNAIQAMSYVDRTYPTGWHVYKYRPFGNGMGTEVMEVKCRKPLAHGIQDAREVGIFKEVLFL